MMTEIKNNGVNAEIMESYAKIRANNEAELEKIKSQVYTHFPRILEIDKELDRVSINVCSDVLNGRIAAKNASKELERVTKELVCEKDEILKRAGLSPECLSERYNCKKCRDTGWDGGKLCECYHKRVRLALQKRSNITAEKIHTFDDYDLSVYSDKIDEQFGFSPRENAKNILSIAKKYSKTEEKSVKGLFFYGGTGLGKTFTSECIASEFIKNGKEVFYTTASKLFNVFEDYKFGRDTTGKAKSTIDYIENADLLIIDDLGTEFRTQYIDSILFNIVNDRTKYNKYMIISTNLTPNQLESVYTSRISSRIFGYFETVLFFGDDVRVK